MEVCPFRPVMCPGETILIDFCLMHSFATCSSDGESYPLTLAGEQRPEPKPEPGVPARRTVKNNVREGGMKPVLEEVMLHDRQLFQKEW